MSRKAPRPQAGLITALVVAIHANQAAPGYDEDLLLNVDPIENDHRCRFHRAAVNVLGDRRQRKRRLRSLGLVKRSPL